MLSFLEALFCRWLIARMGSFTICPQLGFIKAAARKQNQRCKDQCGSCHPPNMRPVPFVFRVRKSATIKLTHYQPQVVGQFDCGSRGVESDRFQAHIRGMSEKPKFHTKMVKDGRWTVAFTAGYGPAENIGDFATEEEAQRWIAKDSAAWLKEHVSGK